MPCVLRSDPERPIPPVVRDVLLNHGWTEYDETLDRDKQPAVTLYWKTNRFYPSEIAAMKYPRQRVNHYPRSSEITKKDLLYRHMRRMKGVFGDMYSFVPTTYALPTEYVKFCQFYAAERERATDEGRSDPMYICKPSELSRGRKIFCFTDIGDLTYDCSSVVQSYVANPLLINGHKTDFRIYVLVASFKPLRAYIFEDGLARMSAEKYDVADVKNIFAHLTNYSINKNSEHWDDVKEGIGSGFKWDLPRTRQYFAELGVDFEVLFDRIQCLVCLTLLSICNNVALVPQCFELYGFDILFDESFKPWLMEVNFSPALAVESDVDARVKQPLIWDLVRTLGISEPPPDDEGTTTDAEAASPTRSTLVSGEVPRPPLREKDTAKGGGGKQKTATTSGQQLPTGKEISRKTPPTSLPNRVTSSATERGRPQGTAGASQVSERRRVESASGRNPAPVVAKRSTRTNSVARELPGKPTASTSSLDAPVFVDSAAGQFRRCFPFNSTVEELSLSMASASAPDRECRAIIAELRKRDLKNIAAIKSWKLVPKGPTTAELKEEA